MSFADPAYILFLSAFLFAAGVTVVVVKRSAVFILIGIELMLNAANINLVAAGALFAEPVEAQVFAIFVIVIAAAEAAVGLAIILQVYRHYRNVNIANFNKLKG